MFPSCPPFPDYSSVCLSSVFSMPCVVLYPHSAVFFPLCARVSIICFLVFNLLGFHFQVSFLVPSLYVLFPCILPSEFVQHNKAAYFSSFLHVSSPAFGSFILPATQRIITKAILVETRTLAFNITFHQHVKSLVQYCFVQMRNIAKVRPVLPNNISESLISSVTYCNL